MTELERAKNLIYSALHKGCSQHWREDAETFLGTYNPYGFGKKPLNKVVEDGQATDEEIIETGVNFIMDTSFGDE